MNDLELEKTRKALINALLKTKDARTYSGGSELAIYCPRCSHLHPNSGPHLYIGILGNGPLKFDCKHCQYQGLVTPNVLKEVNLYQSNFVEYTKIINRLNVNSQRKQFNSDMNIQDLIIPTNILKKDEFKIEYLSERTGIDFSDKEELIKHNVVLNLSQFLRLNKIDLTEKYRLEYLEKLSNSSFGFLSYNKNVINLRNINDPILKRYTNIKINYDISFPFLYIPPVELDILTKAPQIVVSEGAFDILCIKKRFFPSDVNNIIFGAVGSSGSYLRAIKKLVNLTCFLGGNIVVFSDSDVKLEMYKTNFKDLKQHHNIKIIYNTLNKDFGHIDLDVKLKSFKI